MPPSNKPAQSNIVPELRSLLGNPVVFIPWPRGVKATKRKWGHLRADDMTANYLAKLHHGNIGVALGSVSGGLCAIDIDNDDFVSIFEQANPWTATTLQTHGSRGRVFWVRFTGNYPQKSKYLKTSTGVDVGEFRSNGNQSIVWGIHPDTKEPYQRIRNSPVAQIDFAEICWPAGVVAPPLQSGRDDEMKSRGAEDAVFALSLPCSIPVNQSNLVPCAYGGDGLPDAMRTIVDNFLPVGSGRNNWLLFQIARRLKFLEGIKPAILSAAFDRWYEQAAARGFLKRDETKDDYAGKFWLALDNAKTAPQIFESAVKLARSSTLPPEAGVFESESGKLVAAICYQMHLQVPDGDPWYLPTRKGQAALGIHWTTVAGHLARLRGLEIIVPSSPFRNSHDPSLRRATRYVWRGLQRKVD